VGSPYSHNLAASGGKAPYSWALTSGVLPADLQFNTTTGLISGTPTSAANNFPLTFRVTDASSPAQSATRTLSLTIRQQQAASISATSGTPQTAPINTAFGAPLIATVRDSDGNPLPNVTVTFSSPTSGAGGTFAGGVNTAVTNASGVATSAAFTANATSGSYVVSASAPGVAAPAAFSLTNTAGAAAAVSASGGTPQSTSVNTAFAHPPVRYGQ
jgi:hypothetical protein